MLSRDPSSVLVPLTVPRNRHEDYVENYLRATKNSGRLFLFAGDQKIEHLNQNFVGPTIPPECADPEHLFCIADQSPIGAFATQMGLIARYGMKYQNINYVIKLNSKSNIVPTSVADPLSRYITTPEQAIDFACNSGLSVVGLGYTIYLGSIHENIMLTEAANMIYHAHQHGMLAILWIYPRGKAITNEHDAALIAGAAGVGLCLGADFIKINPPRNAHGQLDADLLKQAVVAAGKTQIICSGGTLRDEATFLQDLYDQIHSAGTAGAAIGRNIHQRTIADAVRFCTAISKILFENNDMGGTVKHTK